MFRFMLGIGVGAALIYYLDPERGAERRTKANTWLRQYVNSETIEQARQTTLSQARNIGQQISQQAGSVTDRVNQYRTSRREGGQQEAAGTLNSATAGANI